MLKITNVSGKAVNFFFESVSSASFQLEGGMDSFEPGNISYNPVTGLLSVTAPSCVIYGLLGAGSVKRVNGNTAINYDILMLI